MKFSFNLTVAALGLVAVSAHAASFSPNNLVVERVGSGSAALVSGAATAVFLDEYTKTGTLVQSVAMPGGTTLTASSSASSEGLINRSADGQSLLITGYNAAPGTASVASTTSSTVLREVASVGVNGSVQATTLGTFLSGNNVRSGAAAVTGGGAYVSGANGIGYANGGTVTTLASTNARDLGIFGGQLYYSTGSGTNGIYALGSGLPTTAGQTATPVVSVTNPYAFYFADLSSAVSGLDTLFVAVDTTTAASSGLFKFTKSAGGAWSASGSITGTILRGLTATENNGLAQLYAANDSKLFSFADGGYGVSLSGSLTTLATAATNTVFRGVALTPEAVTPSVPEPESYGLALVSLVLIGAAARRYR